MGPPRLFIANLYDLYFAPAFDLATHPRNRTTDRGGVVAREENKADRREVLIGLTSEGERLVRDVTGRRRSEIAAIVSAMPRGRRRDVVAALNAFALAVGEPSPATGTVARLGW